MIYLPSSETGLSLLQGDWAFPNNLNAVLWMHKLRIWGNITFGRYLLNNCNRVQGGTHRALVSLPSNDNIGTQRFFLGLLCFRAGEHSLTLASGPSRAVHPTLHQPTSTASPPCPSHTGLLNHANCTIIASWHWFITRNPLIRARHQPAGARTR